MRSLFFSYLAYVRTNSRKLRFIVWLCALAATLYYVTLYFWHWSNTPRFLLIFSSMPWFYPLWWDLAHFLKPFWPIRSFFDTVFLSFGFGLNAAILYSIVGWLHSLRRITRLLQ